MRNISSRFILAAGFLLATTTAYAQTDTTGAVQGTVKDNDGSEVVGATVVATSPSLKGTQAEITGEGGSYYLASLPPGTYEVTVYYGEGKWTRRNVIISLGKTVRINIGINTTEGGGEKIIVSERAPVIDSGSTKTGTVIKEDYTRRIPTGRTFQGALGAAAGSQGDQYGVSFGGSTSAENVYIVEGINTTDPAYGTSSTNLPNEFVRETEIITGGYNAEYGRATGAVVNVVTKSGGNEFHGSVFSYFTPGSLSPEARVLAREGSAVSFSDDLNYSFSAGAELGGPIVKDKVWFHVGVNPSLSGDKLTRRVNTFIDEDQDGVPDTYDNGFSKTETLRTNKWREYSREYSYTGKISFAPSQDHQGALSVFGNPSNGVDVATGSLGSRENRSMDYKGGAYDVSGKWTSKFNDNKTQIDAFLGFHRNRSTATPRFAAGDASAFRYDFSRPLTEYSSYEPGGVVPAGCRDGGNGDLYPMIENCPVTFYNVGGLGYLEDITTDRLAAGFKGTQRVKLAGHHQFKAGADFEENASDHVSMYTGGRRNLARSDGLIRVDRLFTVSPMGDDGVTIACGEDIDDDGNPDATCGYRAGGLPSQTTTRNFGAFLQDEWAILPNLSLNMGVRWERQMAYTAEHIQGEISPTTGSEIPKEAFTIANNVAPRIGVIYDWTEEGRSKVFGHWGRFYESIPMDINIRAYGGEVTSRSFVDPTGCSDPDDPTSCDPDGDESVFAYSFGGGEEMVVPGLKGQYMDEIILGAEYELFEDFKVGATYIRRGLGRIIEDVSTDGANTYVVANPGEIDQGAIDDLRDEADQLAMSGAAEDITRANFLNFQADQFEGAKVFDKPIRRYNALQLTAEKRFSKDLMLLASYTYSKTEGNFPGLFSPDTGQLDPNLTSMFDLPELMANRYGDLPHDRPHQIKVDGYYQLNVGTNNWFVFGASARAASGIPINVLGAHDLYGYGESYILDRGEGGRMPWATGFDARVTYGRQLTSTVKLEGFFDAFNLLNSETTVAVDDNYTYDGVNPIGGGDHEDLKHLKVLGGGDAIAEENPNYKAATSAQNPLWLRFGVRLTF